MTSLASLFPSESNTLDNQTNFFSTAAAAAAAVAATATVTVSPSDSPEPVSLTSIEPVNTGIIQAVDNGLELLPSKISIETPTVREGIALYNLPTCYRQVHRRMELCEPLFMNISVFEFEARSSFRKCPTRTKNQERIFIPGDVVSILMNFDPFTHAGDVWFVVRKKKTGATKLWKRSWAALKCYLQSYPRIATMRLRVQEAGYVYEDKRAHPPGALECLGASGALPLECAAVAFGTPGENGVKKNVLWMEVGLFTIENVKGEVVDINEYLLPKIRDSDPSSSSSSPK